MDIGLWILLCTLGEFWQIGTNARPIAIYSSNYSTHTLFQSEIRRNITFFVCASPYWESESEESGELGRSRKRERQRVRSGCVHSYSLCRSGVVHSLAQSCCSPLHHVGGLLLACPPACLPSHPSSCYSCLLHGSLQEALGEENMTPPICLPPRLSIDAFW